MSFYLRACCFHLLLATMLAAPAVAAEAQQHTQFNVHKDDQGKAPSQSLFDLTFGSVPKMATERGILTIDAFFDADGDMLHGPDEDTLSNDIQCTIDEIDYTVPAFIPGLDYNETYELDCHGTRYLPQVNEDLVFIRKRGQVIQVDLPCRLMSAEDLISQGQTASGKNITTATN